MDVSNLSAEKTLRQRQTTPVKKSINPSPAKSTEEPVVMDVGEIFGSSDENEVQTVSDKAPAEDTAAEEKVEEEVKPVRVPVADPRMFVYIDCEMTGLSMHDDLISIGLVTSEGHTFYGEIIDFDFRKVTDWVLKNVIANLTNPPTVLSGNDRTIRGTKEEVKTALDAWLREYVRHIGLPIQLVSDCGSYDMAFFVDLLFGDALSIPDWITPVMQDINQDIANILRGSIKRDVPEGTPVKEVPYNPYKSAFDLSREEYANRVNFKDENNQHNSLHDAMVIRAIHHNLWPIDIPKKNLSVKATQPSQS